MPQATVALVGPPEARVVAALRGPAPRVEEVPRAGGAPVPAEGAEQRAAEALAAAPGALREVPPVVREAAAERAPAVAGAPVEQAAVGAAAPRAAPVERAERAARARAARAVRATAARSTLGLKGEPHGHQSFRHRPDCRAY